MTLPKPHLELQVPYRNPQRIADIAQCEASLREAHTERAGLIYMLAEILTALHRHAEGLDTQNKLLDELTGHVKSWLPSTF